MKRGISLKKALTVICRKYMKFGTAIILAVIFILLISGCSCHAPAKEDSCAKTDTVQETTAEAATDKNKSEDDTRSSDTEISAAEIKEPSGSKAPMIPKQSENQKQTQNHSQSENQKQTQNHSQSENQEQTQSHIQTEASGTKNETQTEEKVPETHHVHLWVAQTEIIRHDAVTQQVWVEDQEAWDEPVYALKVVCGCGAVFEDDCQWEQHSIDGCPYGYSVRNVQTGTIHHEASGHFEDQVIEEAYDETVITGYICSGCQAVK